MEERQESVSLEMESPPALYVLETKDDIPKFLEAIGEPERNTERSPTRLSALLQIFHYPITVVCEYEHVDRSYRDTFYTYFSGKHEKFGRNCKRLSFFAGEMDMSWFFNGEYVKTVEGNFIGVCVLKPIVLGKIGRTVLDPSKLDILPCYVKTTSFRFNILGHSLSVNGFPFCSQDTETMTCAQITIWDIMEYYGTLSAEYSTVLPSQITGELEKISNDRVIPARGMFYEEMSYVLKAFGFASKLYDREAYKKDTRLFQRFFHYYAASGVPLAVGITIERQDTQSGKIVKRTDRHSVVCMGHGEIPDSVSIDSLVERYAQYLDKKKCYPYIDSAELYQDYVIMDDNSVPYQVLPFDKLMKWDENLQTEEAVSPKTIDITVTHFAVPLYRRVFLTADTVPSIVRRVLENPLFSFLNVMKKFEKVSGEKIDQKNPLILRIFLALSTNYKNYRAVHAESAEAQYYSLLRMPRYVWIAEIATFQSFRQNEIYGEMVIDATASPKTLDGLLMIRYLNHTGFCEPEITDQEQVFRAIHAGLEYERLDFRYRYQMYQNNLRKVP